MAASIMAGIPALKDLHADLRRRMDGSVADYYFRPSSQGGATTWIIVLEGGYFCYDAVTCAQRMINSRHLTTSKGNKQLKYVDARGGVLSSSEESNKHWYDANVV